MASVPVSTKSERGHDLLIVGNNTFSKTKVLKSGEVYWRCAMKNTKCPAKIFTVGHDVKISRKELNHNHEDNPKKVCTKIISNNCKRKAQEDISEKPSKIIRTELSSNLSDTLTTADISNIRKNIYNCRRRFLPSTLPKNMEEDDKAVRALDPSTGEDKSRKLENCAMFDTERFIEEIERRPSLWDSSSEQYANRKKNDQDWQEVADIILPGWQELEDSQKVYRGKDLLTKWKNIKDQYRKVLKENQTLHLQPSTPGVPTKKFRKYVYYDKLHFLRPTMKLNCNYNPAPLVPKEENSSPNPENEPEINPLSILNLSYKPCSSTSSLDASSENEELNFSETPERNPNELNQDDDYLFCMFLVPLLKKVPEISRIRTKIDILTIIDNYVNGKDESST